MPNPLYSYRVKLSARPGFLYERSPSIGTILRYFLYSKSASLLHVHFTIIEATVLVTLPTQFKRFKPLAIQLSASNPEQICHNPHHGEVKRDEPDEDADIPVSVGKIVSVLDVLIITVSSQASVCFSG